MTTTTGLIRQAGAKCDNEYARTIATLDAWSSPCAWTSVSCDTFAVKEAARNAKSGARLLRAVRARDGGTHFEITHARGHIRSSGVAA
jgi:hypothetical protein